MAAINGLDERQVAGIVTEIGGAAAQLYIAGINASRQIILAGAEQALDAALAIARSKGAYNARRLDVSVPSHCALLQGVASRLQAALSAIEMRPPKFIYVTNLRARAVLDAAGVREDLINNVSHTIRWHDSISLLQRTRHASLRGTAVRERAHSPDKGNIP